MALTWTPNNSYSSYSCNFCGVSSQVLVEQRNEEDQVVVDENYVPILINDEPAASAEIGDHIQTEHPPEEDDPS